LAELLKFGTIRKAEQNKVNPSIMVHPPRSLPLLLLPLLATTAFLPHTIPRHPSSISLQAKKRDIISSNSSDDDNNNRPAPSASKLSALEGVLSRIERNYGRGSIVKLGDADGMVVDSFGSGSLTLGKLDIFCSLVSMQYAVDVNVWMSEV
jgi:hypothetical protein